MRYVSIIAGRKSNKGMYEYKKGSKKREENPAAKAIVERYKLAPKEKYEYQFMYFLPKFYNSTGSVLKKFGAKTFFVLNCYMSLYVNILCFPVVPMKTSSID